LVDHPSSERFICQTIPESPDADFFATLFDDEAGIAILSAYSVTFEQAQSIGDFPRQEVSNSWRTDAGENNLYRFLLLLFSAVVVVVDWSIHEPPSPLKLFHETEILFFLLVFRLH